MNSKDKHILDALAAAMTTSMNSYVSVPINDNLADLWRELYDQIKPKSVLEKSEIGRNLHQLLEESKHPLTKTALAYIRELEEERDALRKEKDQLKQDVSDLSKTNMKLSQRVNQLQTKAYHPAMRR